MKKNSVIKMVLITLLVTVICTWIFDVPVLNNFGLQPGNMKEVGIFNIFRYFDSLFSNYYYVILFTISVGVFYGVLYKIPAYKSLLDMIVKEFEGKENIFLGTVIALISLIVSVTGFQFGMILLFPFIISLVLLMGYNKLVALTVTVGSTMVGVIGTTLGTNTTGKINSVLNITYQNELISRIILLVLCVILLIYNVIKYASKTRNIIDKELDYVPSDDNEVQVKELKEKHVLKNLFDKFFNKKNNTKKNENKKMELAKIVGNFKPKKNTGAKKKVKTIKSKKTKASDSFSDSVKVVKNDIKVNVWPLVVLFDLLVLILVLSALDWQAVFNTKWPSELLDTIKNIPVLSKILGSDLRAFGQWTYGFEMSTMILLFSVIIACVYKVGINKYFEGARNGIKKVILPVVMMLVVYLVCIIVNDHNFHLYIISPFIKMFSGLNVITMTISLMIASIFNIETVNIAGSTLSYITIIIRDSSLYPIISVMIQSIYGLMMIIAPTSVVLIGSLSYLDVSYIQWIKHIWKLFLEILGLLILFFFILVLI